jgi:hypothetical protein
MLHWVPLFNGQDNFSECLNEQTSWPESYSETDWAIIVSWWSQCQLFLVESVVCSVQRIATAVISIV